MYCLLTFSSHSCQMCDPCCVGCPQFGKLICYYRADTTVSSVISQIGENLHPSTENHVYPSAAVPKVPVPTQGTFRSGRGVLSDSAVHSTPSQQHHEPSSRTPTAIQRNVEEAVAAEGESIARSWSDKESSANDSEQAGDGRNRMEVNQASDQLLSPSERPQPQHTEQSHPHPNMVEPLSEHRVNGEYVGALTRMLQFSSAGSHV